jgi:hypothetical protein
VKPGDAALDYAERHGWPVFPCRWRGEGRKRPLTRRGFLDSSRDPDQIRDWWQRWPEALIGLPTGQATAVVVDVDRKNGIDGFDTLDEFGAIILPETRSHTLRAAACTFISDPASTPFRTLLEPEGAASGKVSICAAMAVTSSHQRPVAAIGGTRITTSTPLTWRRCRRGLSRRTKRGQLRRHGRESLRKGYRLTPKRRSTPLPGASCRRPTASRKRR